MINKYIIVATKNKTLFIINENKSSFYKIPLKNKINFKKYFVCRTTLNSQHTQLYKYKNIKNKNIFTYQPVFFDKFKFIGKGFKISSQKKNKLINFVFGHSHIYWTKLLNTFLKKTKKYKFFFACKNIKSLKKVLSILRGVKPINKYTLRGLRTYDKVWYKRKGRKSVATHI